MIVLPVAALSRDGVVEETESFAAVVDSVSKDFEVKVRPKKGTPEYYEYKVEAYNRFWKSLIPNQSRFQYAGNVGMFNLGLGWHYGGKDRRLWETDFMFGLLLKNNKHHNHMTFTMRQS